MKNKNLFLFLFIFSIAVFIGYYLTVPVDRGVPTISATHFDVVYQYLDNYGCLIAYIIYNPYEVNRTAPIVEEIPKEIINNTEIIIVDYRFLSPNVKDYAPKGYKFVKVNWSRDMINFNNNIIEVKNISLSSKTYTILPMYCIFKNPPVYPYGKFIEANITKTGNNIYKLKYKIEFNGTLDYVRILIPQKIGYSEEYKRKVINYKKNISEEFDKIRKKYELFIFEDEVDELLKSLTKYTGVETPKNYSIEQKAKGHLIYSKDFLGYYPKYYGYYTNNAYYEIISKNTSGEITFYSTGKAIAIIDAKLSKQYINELYHEKKILFINQEDVTG
ncbi:conserved hypothetical protein [Methanocaldococcus vulcanius M7]|uniref:Uncharacterized protein n=1 Tax=Methanocaldococcus vulcanius (strain ATCC 700851 / DSM 12094 / M7) TaxID=579137 RepID=C9RFW6_METVM|nr:hypothetical protein [Methanocaldococcus vulcanius]ACX72468.1 conserved hypothetical protein [Methanocaldococcus vulcanius M7]